MKFKKDSGNGAPGVPQSLGIVKKMKRYLLCLVLGFISNFIIDYILSELLVFWYMRMHGIVCRGDLSNDYGLGILGLTLSATVFIIFFPVSVFVIWKLLKKYDV